jgi:hypothetical protein
MAVTIIAEVALLHDSPDSKKLDWGCDGQRAEAGCGSTEEENDFRVIFVFVVVPASEEVKDCEILSYYIDFTMAALGKTLPMLRMLPLQRSRTPCSRMTYLRSLKN